MRTTENKYYQINKNINSKKNYTSIPTFKMGGNNAWTAAINNCDRWGPMIQTLVRAGVDVNYINTIKKFFFTSFNIKKRCKWKYSQFKIILIIIIIE